MLKGKKVLLRPLEEDDLGFCQVLYNDSHIRDMVVGWDFPSSLRNQKIWFESLCRDKNNIRLIIETKKEGRIGLTGLWNIDWHNRTALNAIKLLVNSRTRGKGYGRDAIMTMCAFAFFNAGMRKLWCEILDYNIPSLKAYVDKSGWKIEGRLRKHVLKNGAEHDLYFAGCLKEDFLKVPDVKDYIPPRIPEGMKPVNLRPKT
ncbi:MAG: GNAT family protein [Candidatus Omnitrophota bacterium]